MNMPYAYPGPALSALIRQEPADFQVEEILPFGPDGEGQHAWIRLRKTGINTEEAARRLARLAGVPLSQVGFAGLKDRQAVTTQYFTVDLAGKEEPDWQVLAGPEIELLEITRHRRKIKRGILSGNCFRLHLRELRGDPAMLAERLARIGTGGFPNFFGEQRFGFGQGNVEKAAALLAGSFRPRDRHLRGIYLSAARSVLFNAVLEARIRAGNWDQILPGELVMLEGSRSMFLATPEELPELNRRAADLDVHPSGPLCGRGGLQAVGLATSIETEALAAWQGPEPFARDGLEWAAQLSKQGLDAARRPLRALASDLRMETSPAGIWLAFQLPAGSYATSLLRELLQAEGLALPESDA
ncbi:tRNA pseudouridine(13) synthase TruD [Thermithiobacillus plumbiphilus]|uniref:tRNA pseudouridine synthase D n=1 Tax=Thermithiobacillus plumbiphilus TaxID=1729899 RepID=A0ABU9DAR9_9PROT